MKYSESEKFILLENQINGMSALLKIARIIPCVVGGREKVRALKEDLSKIKKQFYELMHLPDEFNDIFSKFGWIAYDRMNMDFMRSQVERAKIEGPDCAIAGFLEFYNQERIEQEIMFLNGVDCIRPRMDLIRLAFNDHKEGRYHAVVPVLLMMIDGIVNDVAGKGMHADNQELDAWDSITSIDNGIKVIHDIFRRGRHKTRIDEISDPYRNGILHGLDLGYGNINVAVKCWHYLFVIRDWADSKITEDIRSAKFAEETKPIEIRKLLKKVSNTESVKKSMETWQPREYAKEYLAEINKRKHSVDARDPDEIVFKFFEFLERKNFKDLSSLFWKSSYGDENTRIPRIRNEYKNKQYNLIEVTSITQCAPVIYEIDVNADSCRLKFRLLYQSNSEDIAFPDLDNGKWQIVWVNECDE